MPAKSWLRPCAAVEPDDGGMVAVDKPQSQKTNVPTDGSARWGLTQGSMTNDNGGEFDHPELPLEALVSQLAASRWRRDVEEIMGPRSWRRVPSRRCGLRSTACQREPSYSRISAQTGVSLQRPALRCSSLFSVGHHEVVQAPSSDMRASNGLASKMVHLNLFQIPYEELR